jgi:DNA-binding transcriptional LysR family regulator
VRQSLARCDGFRALGTFLEVDHLATVTGLVTAGLGASLVPAMTLFQFRHPRIRVVPLAARDRIERPLYIIRRSDKMLSSAAQAFHALLLSERQRLRQELAQGRIQ